MTPPAVTCATNALCAVAVLGALACALVAVIAFDVACAVERRL